jgi:tRNA1Val (adenine37-N6)-methyltransferase
MSHFDFKQFRVSHDRCAMKVGTDGVLLGAWSPIEGSRRILDIGTGSGLVALMLAQRSNARIVGVELDTEAATQASENALASPFASRIEIVNADILDYRSEEKFDAIVSNPPFFNNALECPEIGRSRARHTSSLPLNALIDIAFDLLTEGGTFSVILPSDVAQDFLGICIAKHFTPIRITSVRTVPRKAPKRTLMSFKKGIHPDSLVRDELSLASPLGQRSELYQELTKDFYLDR